MARVLLLLLLVAGCSSSPTTLVVDLKTDLVPGVEINGARLVFAGTREPISVPVTRADDFTSFARLFETTVVPGTHELRLDLLDDDGIVAQRPVLVDVDEGGRVISLVIARTCAAAGCSDDQACLGGRCVDPTCIVEITEGCGDPECTMDSECPAGDACARAECASGACLLVDRGSCGAAGYCHPIDGCVFEEEDGGVDAGSPDAGSPDAGPPCAADRCVSHELGGLVEYDAVVQTGSGGDLVADAAGALGGTGVGLRARADPEMRQHACVDLPPAARSVSVEMLVDLGPALAAPPTVSHSVRFVSIEAPDADGVHVGIVARPTETVSWHVGFETGTFVDPNIEASGPLTLTITRASSAGVADGRLDFSGPGLPSRGLASPGNDLFWDATRPVRVCVGAWSLRATYSVPEVRFDELLFYVDR